jgi:hypothetical protein
MPDFFFYSVICSSSVSKVYNCEDLRVTVPPMEVHNITWTWRDFLMAIKDHSKMAVFTQFFKQKIKPRSFSSLGGGGSSGSGANAGASSSGSAGGGATGGDDGGEGGGDVMGGSGGFVTSSADEEKIRKIMGDWMLVRDFFFDFMEITPFFWLTIWIFKKREQDLSNGINIASELVSFSSVCT